jgi:alkylhydroperoxidase family enzyme
MPRLEPVPTAALPARARELVDAGIASGMYDDGHGQPPAQLRAMAYNRVVLEATYAQSRVLWRDGLLGDRLSELVRIRSAQVNGCVACAGRIKGDEVTADDVACMVEALPGGLDEREAAAVALVGEVAGEHHAIDDDRVRSLARLFSPAELVELVYRICVMLGQHRFHHLFRSYEPGEPVIPFDPAHIDAPRAEAVAAVWTRTAEQAEAR